MPKLKKLKTIAKDDAVITSSQRKKIERVKIPVTSFKRMHTQNGNVGTTSKLFLMMYIKDDNLFQNVQRSKMKKAFKKC